MPKFSEPKLGEGITIRQTTHEDIPAVLALLRERAGNAVLDVSKKELGGWIEKGHSWVGEFKGLIVAHQAIDIWGQVGYAEFRSAAVAEHVNGQNVNYHMKKIAMSKAAEFQPEVVAFVALKNGDSNGIGILEALDFKPISATEVPSVLFSIGSGQEWKVHIRTMEDFKNALRSEPD